MGWEGGARFATSKLADLYADAQTYMMSLNCEGREKPPSCLRLPVSYSNTNASEGASESLWVHLYLYETCSKINSGNSLEPLT